MRSICSRFACELSLLGCLAVTGCLFHPAASGYVGGEIPPGDDGGQPPPGDDGGQPSPGDDGGQPSPGGDGGRTAQDGGITTQDGGENASATPFFIDSGPRNEGGSQIVVDARGHQHIIHVAGGSGVLCGGQVRYGYCAGACQQPSSWQFVDLVNVAATCDQSTGEVSVVLAVNGQGQPRVLTVTGNTGASYSECNSSDSVSCTNAGNWTTANISTRTPVGNPYGSKWAGQRFFAVAGAGAAFAYSDSARGLVYVSCASSCSTLGNWQETVIVPVPAGYRGSSFSAIAIAFTKQGSPRLSYFSSAGNTPPGLAFAACDSAGCPGSGWSNAVVVNNLTHAEPILALDAQDHPRILADVVVNGSNQNVDQWLWCDDAKCTTQQSWHGPYATGNLIAQAMALDAQGNPHVVSGAAMGSSYRWCSANCTSMTTAPMWQEMSLSDSQLDMADPATSGSLPPYWLSNSRWLALDAAGNAIVTIDGWRYPWDAASTGASPDRYGVLLQVVAAPR
jgi:hypothetical protein